MAFFYQYVSLLCYDLLIKAPMHVASVHRKLPSQQFYLYLKKGLALYVLVLALQCFSSSVSLLCRVYVYKKYICVCICVWGYIGVTIVCTCWLRGNANNVVWRFQFRSYVNTTDGSISVYLKSVWRIVYATCAKKESTTVIATIKFIRNMP